MFSDLNVVPCSQEPVLMAFFSLAEVSILSIHCYFSLEVFLKRWQCFYSFFVAVGIPPVNSS